MADRRTAEIVRAIGTEIRRLREDAGVSQASLSRAAGVSATHVSEVEAGTVQPSLSTLTALGIALGAELSLRLFPGAGVPIRDRFQARMIEALLRVLHRSWSTHLEVPVVRPARGFVDLVLVRGPQAVATEAQSELRRVEAQLRWHGDKKEGLRSTSLWSLLGAGAVSSQLLVLRSTRATREVARTLEHTLAAAFPAKTVDALAALTSTAPWPGAAIVWVRVEGREAEVLQGPPRGVSLGR